nr:hypothetical protein [Tanacetum cinerariifolium]
MLKQGDYEMWRLSIEQYFQVQDYALWDVIENGNSFEPVAQTKTNDASTSTTLIPGPVTTKENAQKKNDVKAKNLVKIHEDDLEKMDLKWQLALLSMRTKRFFQKTGRKVTINGKDTAGYDKSKVSFMVDDEVPTNMALMDFSDSEFNKFEFNLATYKRGLAYVEEQLVFYKKNEVMFCEQIDVLKRDISYKDSEISMLKRLFSPLKLDLFNSALEEFQQSEFEGYGPKNSKSVCEHISNEVKKYPDAPLVKDKVSDNKDCSVKSPVVVKKKIVVPTIAKVEYIRPKQQEKLVKKTFRPRPVNTARPRPVNTDRPNSAVVNVVRVNQVNAIKASACWVWRPTKPNGASITLKRHNYIDVQGRSNLMHKKYGLVVTDDYRRYTWVFFLASKDETTSILKKLIIEIENLVDKKIKNASNDEPQPSSDAEKKNDDGVSKESRINDPDVNTNGLLVTTAPLEAIHADFFGDDTEVETSNISNTYLVLSTPNTRIYKDHSLDHVIGDVQSGVQTKRMTKTINEQGFISDVYEGKDHEDLHACLFACFLSQEEPKKVIQALKDLSWIEAMQEELLQFKLQQDGYTQEERIDYDEVFAPVARIEAIRLFLAYASFKDFIVYQMDVKSAFLYGKIEEEVYVCQPSGFEDPEFPDKVYKVEKALYSLHQAPRAWTAGETKNDRIFINQDKYVDEILKKFDFSTVKTASTLIETSKPLLKDVEVEDVDVHLYRSMIGSLMFLTSSRPDIMFVVCACARFQVTPKVSHLHDAKRIFRYLKGQPKLGLWYPKDSPFDLEAYTDSDYAGVSLDGKSTTGGCQLLRSRLILWQCKKQTVIVNSTIEADAICIVKNPVFHSKIKHIEIRHHFIRDSNEKKLIQMIKIHTDQNVVDLLVKAFDVGRFQYLVASIGMLNL